MYSRSRLPIPQPLGGTRAARRRWNEGGNGHPWVEMIRVRGRYEYIKKNTEHTA